MHSSEPPKAVTAETGTPPWQLPTDHEHAIGVSIIAEHLVTVVVRLVAPRITAEVADRLVGVTA